MSVDSLALKVVEAALAIEDAEARSAFVADQCGENASLRARVMALLAFDSGDRRLAPTETFVVPLAIIDNIPSRIGLYRVTSEIARGGMGAVVKAQRDDGVFERQVAIKLIRSDLASERTRARFAEERRILARLDHPGIVRILDGGELEHRPWLAMEFVDGQPITEALRGATQVARLDGFEAVCEAVAYAHRNLVVHADIKPSNVLMTDDGAVHLLDFGIARLLVDLNEDEAGDPYPLTKGYTAPERGVGVAPTIASDVFSLGVLLLGMLGHALPQDDTVCVAGSRLPRGQLEGDLAAIAGKALAERPEDRYPDVAALLSDIRRHRAFVPVAARANAGWHYGALRFIQRHRKGLAVTAVSALGLVALTVFSALQYVRAERAQARAEARFLEVRSLARFQLFDLYDQLAAAPGTVHARVAIAKSAGDYLDRLRDAPDAPVDLRLESAAGYRRLATVLGLSGTASLGRPEEAGAALDKADGLLATVLAEDPGNPVALSQAGWVAADRWTLLARDEDSVATNRRARHLFDQALRSDPANHNARLGRLVTVKNEAYDLIKGADRPKDAVPILLQALTDLDRLTLPAELREQSRILEYELHSKLGDARYYGGDSSASLPAYRAALAIADAELRANGEAPPWLARRGEALWNISGVLEEYPQRRAEALALASAGGIALRRVLEFGPDANSEKKLAIIESQRGMLFAALGRSDEAIAALETSLSIRNRRLAASPNDPTRLRDIVIARMSYADTLLHLGRKSEACGQNAMARQGWQDISESGNLTRHDRNGGFADVMLFARNHCQ